MPSKIRTLFSSFSWTADCKKRQKHGQDSLVGKVMKQSNYSLSFINLGVVLAMLRVCNNVCRKEVATLKRADMTADLFINKLLRKYNKNSRSTMLLVLLPALPHLR